MILLPPPTAANSRFRMRWTNCARFVTNCTSKSNAKDYDIRAAGVMLASSSKRITVLMRVAELRAKSCPQSSINFLPLHLFAQWHKE